MQIGKAEKVKAEPKEQLELVNVYEKAMVTNHIWSLITVDCWKQAVAKFRVYFEVKIDIPLNENKG